MMHDWKENKIINEYFCSHVWLNEKEWKIFLKIVYLCNKNLIINIIGEMTSFAWFLSYQCLNIWMFKQYEIYKMKLLLFVLLSLNQIPLWNS
jgi:hypothetical protein